MKLITSLIINLLKFGYCVRNKILNACAFLVRCREVRKEWKLIILLKTKNCVRSQRTCSMTCVQKHRYIKLKCTNEVVVKSIMIFK